MELNVDVIDNETGEIYREGVLLAVAHLFIAKEKGKIVREDTHIEDMDDIDGGGKMEVHDIFAGREVEERVVRCGNNPGQEVLAV